MPPRGAATHGTRRSRDSTAPCSWSSAVLGPGGHVGKLLLVGTPPSSLGSRALPCSTLRAVSTMGAATPVRWEVQCSHVHTQKYPKNLVHKRCAGSAILCLTAWSWQRTVTSPFARETTRLPTKHRVQDNSTPCTDDDRIWGPRSVTSCPSCLAEAETWHTLTLHEAFSHKPAIPGGTHTWQRPQTQPSPQVLCTGTGKPGVCTFQLRH